MAITAGYDVGGAHLKVALAEDGRTIAALQLPCPLWRGLDQLDAAFAQAAPLVSRAHAHAATMTGELCELFPDRATGVAAIVDRLVSNSWRRRPHLDGAAGLWRSRRGTCRPHERGLDQLPRRG